MEKEDRLLNLYQAAERLNIAYITLYLNYVRPRKIKAIKLDGVWRIRESDLDEFVKSREVTVK